MTQVLHPIVAQLTPNEEQRPAICARDCDVVVTAGAGTGKTRTLVARYLSLLADGHGGQGLPLRSIVAITFTRKAAREMRNRVRAEVQRYLARGDHGPSLTAEERERWQAVYAGLDAARIGTIHSLCTEILRAHPAEAGVDPRFRVLEEGQAALLRREVLDAALAWAADQPQAVRLFALLDGAGALRGVLRALLEQRLDAAAAFDALPDEPLAYWQEILQERRRGLLWALVSDPAWLEAVDTLRHTEPTDPEDRMAVERRRALGILDRAAAQPAAASAGSDGHGPDLLDERLETLSRLGDISLVGGSYRAWPGGKAEKDAVKDALRTLRQRWTKQEDLLSLQLTALDEELAEAMPGLRAAFQFARRRYQAEKGNQRALDFDDLESGALALLRDHPAVRGRWQGQVEAILVDEFQDTNQRQRDLVRLLGRAPGLERSAGKLFIVGDAKQSIYGFRGADVAVFRAERERIAGPRNDPGWQRQPEGQGWVLETSYRAHRGLVGALNDLLRPVLGEEADPRRPWAEPFAPIEPHREEPRPGIESPYVAFHLTVGSKGDGALDRAARAVVGRLAEMVEGAHGSLDYGDMAILCRSSRSFRPYEDALDQAGLPYLTVAGRGFYQRPEIRDLLNALRAVSDPTDDLALVGLLRSPAIGLSDAAIYHLVHGRDEAAASGPSPGPLWDVLRRGETALGAGRRAASLISWLHTMAGRAGVGDLLKTFLDQTHYRAALLQASQQRAVRNIDKLLGDAHASGLVGVRAFLEYIAGLQESGAREGEARAAAGGAVQIMTVHQAKGLEFPIVVLGDATWGGGGGGAGVLIDPTVGVLLPVKDEEEDERAAVYRLAQARQEDRADAEADRLLYVAATRAREKLLVSGCLGGIRKDGTPHKPSGWLGQLGRPLGLHELEIPYDEEGDRVHRWELHLGTTSADCFVYEPDCTIYQSSAPAVDAPEIPETPLPPPLLAPIPPQEGATRPQTEPQRVGRVVPGVKRATAPARVVGELVHEALAAWRLPEGRGDKAFEQWLRARARTRGLIDSHQLADAARRSRRLLLRLREHPLFQRLDAAGRRLHEVPFSVERQGWVVSGTIDLLYREGSVWTIVEFKTDEVRRRSDFERLRRESDYVPQVRRYADATEQLLGTRPRCLLCMLDYERRTRVYLVPAAGPLERANLRE